MNRTDVIGHEDGATLASGCKVARATVTSRHIAIRLHGGAKSGVVRFDDLAAAAEWLDVVAARVRAARGL